MDATLTTGAGAASRLKLARFLDYDSNEDTSADERPTLRLFSADVSSVPSAYICDDRAGFGLRHAIALGRDDLLAEQQANGSWLAFDKTCPAILARLLLMLKYLHATDTEQEEFLAEEILSQQLPDGGWAIASSSAVDLSASLLCYAALKLHYGRRVICELANSRQVICELGGAAYADRESRQWLTLFGQSAGTGELDWLPALDASAVSKVNPLNGIGELLVPDARKTEGETDNQPTSAAELLWKRLALESFAADIAGEEIAVLDAEIQQLLAGEGQQTHSNATLASTANAVRALIESGTAVHDSAVGRAISLLVEAGEGGSFNTLSTSQLSSILVAMAKVRSVGAESAGLPPMLRLTESGYRDQRQHAEKERIETIRQHLIEMLALRCSEVEACDTCDLVNVLEALKSWEGDASPIDLDAIVQHLISRQTACGNWNGRETSDDVRLTAQVLKALASGGVDVESDAVLAGVNWLLANQHDCGSWNGDVLVTASAIAALAATGFATDEASELAVGWLMDAQLDTGGWSSSDCNEPSQNSEMMTTAAVLASLCQAAVNDSVNPSREESVCLRLAMTGTMAV